jgi:glycosyltransferase involved in cell wall biosynthesis
LHTETFFAFPEDVKGYGWIRRFEEKEVLHGFIPRDGATFLSIKRLLEDKYEPLILHSHFVSYDICTIILKLVLHTRAKVVWHLHSRGKLDLRQRCKDIIKVRALAHTLVDRCIAVSEGVYGHSMTRGFDAERLVLIHNGIDLTRFRPVPEARRLVRARLGVTEDQRVYLLLGWDPYTKGVDLFVKAANELARSAQDSNLFLIIGEARTRQFVQPLAESLQLGPALRIIDPMEEFASFLNGVDVVVSASRSEGLPYALLEGMANGKLVLASDIPGARETYGGSHGTWLFPPEDWLAQAACMRRARTLPDVERQRLGEANARYVAEHYSLDRWASEVGDLYKILLGQATTPW